MPTSTVSLTFDHPEGLSAEYVRKAAAHLLADAAEGYVGDWPELKGLALTDPNPDATPPPHPEALTQERFREMIARRREDNAGDVIAEGGEVQVDTESAARSRRAEVDAGHELLLAGALAPERFVGITLADLADACALLVLEGNGEANGEEILARAKTIDPADRLVLAQERMAEAAETLAAARDHARAAKDAYTEARIAADHWAQAGPK